MLPCPCTLADCHHGNIVGPFGMSAGPDFQQGGSISAVGMSLQERLSNCSALRNHRGGGVNTQMAGPHPQSVQFGGLGWVQNCAFAKVAGPETTLGEPLV